MSRRRHVHPSAVIMAGGAVLALLAAAAWIVYVAWPLLLAAAIALAAYRLGYRRGQAGLPPVTGRPLVRPVRFRRVLSPECTSPPGDRDHLLCRVRGCTCPCHTARQVTRPLAPVGDEVIPW